MIAFEGKRHFLDRETMDSGEKLTCYPWTSQEGCYTEMQCWAEVQKGDEDSVFAWPLARCVTQDE